MYIYFDQSGQTGFQSNLKSISQEAERKEEAGEEE